MLPMFIIYSAICDVLETDGHVMEAISFFQRMQHEVAPDTCINSEEGQWELSEWYQVDTARDRLNIKHRFSAAMQTEIRGACRGRTGFSELY